MARAGPFWGLLIAFISISNKYGSHCRVLSYTAHGRSLLYGGASANANHKNQLVSIITPTTTYNFDYNALGQRTSVSVGDTVLATYTYTDVDKNLKTLEYGNDDVVNYTTISMVG